MHKARLMIRQMNLYIEFILYADMQMTQEPELQNLKFSLDSRQALSGIQTNVIMRGLTSKQ